jgi:DNA-binding CsgD family transcriptional regulator
MCEPEPLLEAISSGADPVRLWDIATAWLAERGFDRVIHMSVGPPGRDPELRTTMPEHFLRTYAAESFAQDDPFLTYCLATPRFISTGAAYLGDYGYLSPRAQGLIEVAETAGFLAGFSVTTRLRGPAGLEGWNLGSTLGRREVEAIRRHHEQEIAFALHALRGRLRVPDTLLTAREAETMQLLADGCRNRQIAQELGIKEVTVEFHLTNARRKLGATTREASVARFVWMQTRQQ